MSINVDAVDHNIKIVQNPEDSIVERLYRSLGAAKIWDLHTDMSKKSKDRLRDPSL